MVRGQRCHPYDMILMIWSHTYEVFSPVVTSLLLRTVVRSWCWSYIRFLVFVFSVWSPKGHDDITLYHVQQGVILPLLTQCIVSDFWARTSFWKIHFLPSKNRTIKDIQMPMGILHSLGIFKTHERLLETITEGRAEGNNKTVYVPSHAVFAVKYVCRAYRVGRGQSRTGNR